MIASAIWASVLETQERYRENIEAEEAMRRVHHDEFIEAQGVLPVVEPAQWEKAALRDIDEFCRKGGG